MPIEISERVAFLRKIHLFYGLDDEALTRLAQEVEELSVPQGEVIVKQDSLADQFYMIYDGHVRIVRKQDGKEVQLVQLVKDDYFGEMALVSNRRRSATATALKDTSLLILSRDDFRRLFRERRDLSYNLAVALQSRRLAQQLRFKWLRADEVVYFLARKHWIALFPKILIPFMILFASAGFGFAYFKVIPHFIVAFAAVGLTLAALGWLGWIILDWGNDYYVVTNRRVVWLEKVIGIYDSRQESPLHMIVSVGVEMSQLGRILDYGNVIVRTYVGRLDFAAVNHPQQAAKMVNEYWDRTKQAAVATEKTAMKNAIRSRLGLETVSEHEPESESVAAAGPTPKPKGRAILKILGANTLKMRYETDEGIVYRKHWMALFLSAWISALGTLVFLGFFFSRLYQLYFDPERSLFFKTGARVDAIALLCLGGMILFFGGFLFRFLDWSNDKFEITDNQIIDIDRKPLGTETRNAAQLEDILGTKYERKGLLGNLFNYGYVYITVGGSKLIFEDVRDPAGVQADINRRREARVAKKTQAAVAIERERMADWLVAYHRNAEEFRAAEEEKRNHTNGAA